MIYKALHQRSAIRSDFERFDADKSGFISKDELVQVIKDRTGVTVSEKHILRLLKDCDENDDDQINYEEFVTLMTIDQILKFVEYKDLKLSKKI